MIHAANDRSDAHASVNERHTGLCHEIEMGFSLGFVETEQFPSKESCCSVPYLKIITSAPPCTFIHELIFIRRKERERCSRGGCQGELALSVKHRSGIDLRHAIYLTFLFKSLRVARIFRTLEFHNVFTFRPPIRREKRPGGRDEG